MHTASLSPGPHSPDNLSPSAQGAATLTSAVLRLSHCARGPAHCVAELVVGLLDVRADAEPLDVLVFDHRVIRPPEHFDAAAYVRGNRTGVHYRLACQVPTNVPQVIEPVTCLSPD